MMASKNPNAIRIDASGKTLGRLASQVASLLRGKRTVTFQPHQSPNVRVYVKNIGKAKILTRKLTGKVYYRSSGYPGGISQQTLGERFAKDPQGLFRGMVRGMLPSNRLRAQLLKNLTVE